MTGRRRDTFADRTAGRRQCLAAWFLASTLIATPFPVTAELAAHGGAVRAIAVAPDGATALTGSFDYSVGVWDLSTQSLRARLVGHAGPVNAVVFLKDGKWAASGGDDGDILIWDLATHDLHHRLAGNAGKIVALAAVPGGDLLASASWDTNVRVWDSATGTEVLRLDHGAEVNTVVFGGPQTLFSGDKNGLIRVWSLPAGGRNAELHGHELAVIGLSAAADGMQLLSAGIDASLRVWSRDSWKERFVLRGHDAPVLAVSLSPDRRSAVSADRTGDLLIWDVAAGRLVRRCPAHLRPIWAVAHTPDGRRVLTASADATVRVWDVATCAEIGASRRTTAESQPWLSSTHPGARLYRACAPCHALRADGPRRAGPHFAGLFGRPAGTVADFEYSRALREVRLRWDGAALAALLEQGPEGFLPGTRMPLQRIPNAREREALVDYLRILTGPDADAD